MTREKFLHEVIIRLSDPNYINEDARHMRDNWNYPYNHEVVVGVIARITIDLMAKNPELDWFVRNKENHPFDGIVLYFYEKAYKGIIENRFDL
jgi:hypothetical protein